MAEGNEQTFFEHDQIRVTRSRLQIDERTFAMSSISSVALNTLEHPKEVKGLGIVFGLVLAIAGIPALVSGAAAGPLIGVFLIGTGALITWIDVAKLRKASVPTYVVSIDTTGVRAEAYHTQNLELARKIVAAVNEAIIARG